MKISAILRDNGILFAHIKVKKRNNKFIIIQLMRISIIAAVLCITSLQILQAIPAIGQNMAADKVTIGFNNESLESALLQIEEQSDFIFYYKKNDIKPLNHLNMSNETRTIEQTLNQLLQNTFLSFRQIDGHILIERIEHQSNYQIKGHITSLDQKPVTFASVSLLKKDINKIIQETHADSSGYFTLTAIERGEYLVKFSSIGKETLLVNLKLGDEKVVTLNITLPDKINELKEVVVESNAPTINYTPGNIEVNVQNNKYYKGLNTLTLLKRLPGVMYDPSSSSIKLDGKPVEVYINDRPIKLSSEALLSFLQTLPSGTLDKIDLTSQPNAKYDANTNGGIINIHTRQIAKDSWNTQVSYNYDQYRYLEQSFALISTLSVNRFNFTADLNYVNGKGYNETTLTNEFNNSSTGYTNLNEVNNRVYTYNPFNYNLSALLYLNNKRKQSIEAIYTGSSSTTNTNAFFNSDVLSNNAFASQTTTNSFKKVGVPTSDIGLVYSFKIDSTGKTLKILGDHTVLKYYYPANYTTTFYDQNNVISRPDSMINQNYDNRSVINSVKADYAIPKSILKSKLELGVKASWANVFNSDSYYVNQNGIMTTDLSRTNGFKFKENIYAAYLLLSNNITKSLSFQIGGRVEDTKSLGIEQGPTLPFNKAILDTNYVRFYPSGSLLLNLNANNHLSFTINSKITRPQYQQYNPFNFYVDPYNVTKGNPYLLPAINTNMELMYAYKGLFNIKVYYSNQSRQIVNGLYTSDTSALNTSKPVNLDYARYLGITASFQKNLTKWWYLSASSQVGTAYKKGYINGALFDPKNPVEFWISVNQSWTLDKTWTLDNSAFYRNKNFQGVYINNAFSFVNLSIKKSFLSERLYIRAELDDIFNTSGRFQGTYATNQLVNTIHNRYPGRQFVLNLTYSLKNKNINTYHEKSNSEEIQRAKN